jgi:hypothetical protein
MGLFSRKAAAPPPPAAAAPPAKADDPLSALVGMTVGESAFEDGTLTLTFRGPAGEAHLEAYGKLTFTQSPGRHLAPGTAEFKSALLTAPGRRVISTEVRVGDTLLVELDKGLTLAASLTAGSYPGESAVYLKGPGKSYVNFNENGVARLTM